VSFKLIQKYINLIENFTCLDLISIVFNSPKACLVILICGIWNSLIWNLGPEKAATNARMFLEFGAWNLVSEKVDTNTQKYLGFGPDASGWNLDFLVKLIFSQKHQKMQLHYI